MIEIVLKAEDIINRRAEDIVNNIYRDMVTNAPVFTGEVKKTIRVDKVGKYRWIIAPHTDHDWYAEHGNHANSSDGRIHVKRAKAMPITNQSGSVVAYAKSVRPHTGSKFVEKTASKYR